MKYEQEFHYNLLKHSMNLQRAIYTTMVNRWRGKKAPMTPQKVYPFPWDRKAPEDVKQLRPGDMDRMAAWLARIKPVRSN